MKTIQAKTKNFQDSEANQTIARINRLRVAFQEIELGDQEKFIEMLSIEIEQVEDEEVRFWLIKFRSILENVKTQAARV